MRRGADRVQLYHRADSARDGLGRLTAAILHLQWKRTMAQDIAIIDYGMANLRSVQKALERVGHSAVISDNPDVISRAGKLILPGVGAFCDGMAKLRESGLVEPIVDHLRAGRPFLGICLGLQFLFTRGHEDGLHQGLDWYQGDVVRFENQPGLKVPHMGWNQLRLRGNCPLFRGIQKSAVQMQRAATTGLSGSDHLTTIPSKCPDSCQIGRMKQDTHHAACEDTD